MAKRKPSESANLLIPTYIKYLGLARVIERLQADAAWLCFGN